jgi:hypothetical protein
MSVLLAEVLDIALVCHAVAHPRRWAGFYFCCSQPWPAPDRFFSPRSLTPMTPNAHNAACSNAEVHPVGLQVDPAILLRRTLAESLQLLALLRLQATDRVGGQALGRIPPKRSNPRRGIARTVLPLAFKLIKVVGADANLSHMPISDCAIAIELRTAPRMNSARSNRITANPAHGSNRRRRTQSAKGALHETSKLSEEQIV